MKKLEVIKTIKQNQLKMLKKEKYVIKKGQV